MSSAESYSEIQTCTKAKPSPTIFMIRYWYYIGIAAMFTVGLLEPRTGLWMKSMGITPYLIAFAFFLNGFALSTESLLGSLKEWRILFTALIVTFAISPAIVFAVRHLVPGGNSFIGEGFQIVSLVPTLFVSAVVLTRLAKGNAAVALYLTVVSNLLAIVVAPILIKLTLGASASGLNLRSTTVSMIFTVLVPTIVGQAARMRYEGWAVSHARLVTLISQTTILIFIVTGVSSLPRQILSVSVVITALLGGILLHSTLIGIGRLAGSILGVAEADRRALTFCTAQKSFVFNILLCEHLFGGKSNAFGLAILPGIIYYLLVLTIDSVIAQRWEQQTLKEEEKVSQQIVRNSNRNPAQPSRTPASVRCDNLTAS